MRTIGLVVLLVATVVLAAGMVAEADERHWREGQGYEREYIQGCPTLDAWRLAGYQNGYEAGWRGDRPANTTSPEYMEGYHHGKQDQLYSYRSRCGGHRGYPQEGRIIISLPIPLPPRPPWAR